MKGIELSLAAASILAMGSTTIDKDTRQQLLGIDNMLRELRPDSGNKGSIRVAHPAKKAARKRQKKARMITKKRR